MTKWDPDFVQGNGTTPSYTAKEFRMGSRAEDWYQGVRTRRALKVSQRGAGANMTVDVAAGDAIVAGTKQANQGNYAIRSDAIEPVAGFTAPSAGLQRYDLVVVKVNDPDATEAAGDNITFERVAGTASGSPAVPAFPTTAIVLAIVGPISNSTTSITDAMIHDAHTGTGPTGVAGVRLLSGFRDNPGVTKDTEQAVAPNGWAFRNGAEVSRSIYAALFEELGTKHGVGNGTTTFNLPLDNGRVTVAADNMGGSDAGVLTSSNTLGTKMGAEKHTLTTAEMPVHAHSMDHDHPATDVRQSGSGVGLMGNIAPGGSLPWTAPGLGGNDANVILSTFQVDVPNYTGGTGNAGFGGAHNNMQPSITVNRIICLG